MPLTKTAPRSGRQSVPDVRNTVAVPTYVMNGRVVWLGNPAPEELFARLQEAVA